MRIALGARRSGVLWMVLRDALLPVSAGLAVGLPLAVAAARLGMLASTGAALLAVGTVAALAPARRAARTDPMATVRQE